MCSAAWWPAPSARETSCPPCWRSTRSLVAADAAVTARVRQELLEYDAGTLVRGLKEMGIPRTQALDVVARLWDAPQAGEEETP